MGKEKRVAGNVTCRSCQSQEVECPFPCVDEVKAAVGHVAADVVEKKPAARKGPNKTEGEYRHRLSLEFPGAKIIFEGITMHLEAGHAYTPDFVVILATGEIIMVEAKARGKDGYRHPSYQRARCMFDQSRVEYAMWRWRWAEKQSGVWTVENF